MEVQCENFHSNTSICEDYQLESSETSIGPMPVQLSSNVSLLDLPCVNCTIGYSLALLVKCTLVVLNPKFEIQTECHSVNSEFQVGISAVDQWTFDLWELRNVPLCYKVCNL